jgi:hypothetical protein
MNEIELEVERGLPLLIEMNEAKKNEGTTRLKYLLYV